MTMAKLFPARPDAVASSFDSGIHTAAVRRATAARTVPAAADFESESGWDEILQAAARLKVVLGANRRVVAVTGIEPADGGTVLAAKLGAAMAQIDHGRVLVVEGNPASEKIGQLFRLPPGPGFVDVLERRAESRDAIRQVAPDNLFVLPRGEAIGPLATLLTSAAGTSLMTAIREHFRYVIVDAGIIRRDPAGLLLASQADGVVAAVAAGARRRDEIVTFRDELQRLNIPLFGIVLTRVARGRSRAVSGGADEPAGEA